MKAYIRTDPLIDERKGHYAPAQLGTYLMVLCKASRQSNRGRFRSVQALQNMVPASYVRHLGWLYDEGDLVVQDDGTVYVDGWDEWQEGDLTVGDRMQRMRNRKRNKHRNASVTPTVTQPYRSATSTLTLDVDVDIDGSEEPTPLPPKNEPRDPVDTYFTCTTRTPSKGALDWINRLADEHGDAAVSDAMAATWSEDSDLKTFIGRVEIRLVSEERKASKDAEARAKTRAIEETRAAEERRANATPEELAKQDEWKSQIGAFVKGGA